MLVCTGSGELTAKEKEPYNEQARLDKVRYTKEIAAYTYTPPPCGENKTSDTAGLEADDVKVRASSAAAAACSAASGCSAAGGSSAADSSAGGGRSCHGHAHEIHNRTQVLISLHASEVCTYFSIR